MRKSSLTLLLAFLLVFVQHGAVLHELGHLSHEGQSAGSALRADLHPSSAAVCPSCAAYAQVANPAAGTPPSVPLDPAAFIPTLQPGYGIAGTEPLTPRSRGPPSV